MSEATPTPEAPKVFNIDARKSDYEPLRVVFRGQEYVLGRTAAGIMRALSINGSVAAQEGESQQAHTARLLENLPTMTAALCPELPLNDWTVDEEVGLFNAVSEVLTRLGRIRFSTAEG